MYVCTQAQAARPHYRSEEGAFELVRVSVRFFFAKHHLGQVILHRLNVP